MWSSSVFQTRSLALIITALFVGMTACKEQVSVPIEFRLAQTTPAPDFTPVMVPGETDSIYMSNHVELSNPQIDSVVPQVTEQGLILGVWFTPKGKEHLAQITANNIGRRLAIRIGTQVMNAPVIASPIGGTAGPVQVVLGVSGDSANTLASQLRYPQ